MRRLLPLLMLAGAAFGALAILPTIFPCASGYGVCALAADCSTVESLKDDPSCNEPYQSWLRAIKTCDVRDGQIVCKRDMTMARVREARQAVFGQCDTTFGRRRAYPCKVGLLGKPAVKAEIVKGAVPKKDAGPSSDDASANKCRPGQCGPGGTCDPATGLCECKRGYKPSADGKRCRRHGGRLSLGAAEPASRDTDVCGGCDANEFCDTEMELCECKRGYKENDEGECVRRHTRGSFTHDVVKAVVGKCEGVSCANGTCDPETGECVCEDGWQGSECQDKIPAELSPTDLRVCPPSQGDEVGCALEAQRMASLTACGDPWNKGEILGEDGTCVKAPVLASDPRIAALQAKLEKLEKAGSGGDCDHFWLWLCLVILAGVCIFGLLSHGDRIKGLEQKLGPKGFKQRMDKYLEDNPDALGTAGSATVQVTPDPAAILRAVGTHMDANPKKFKGEDGPVQDLSSLTGRIEKLETFVGDRQPNQTMEVVVGELVDERTRSIPPERQLMDGAPKPMTNEELVELIGRLKEAVDSLGKMTGGFVEGSARALGVLGTEIGKIQGEPVPEGMDELVQFCAGLGNHSDPRVVELADQVVKLHRNYVSVLAASEKL